MKCSVLCCDNNRRFNRGKSFFRFPKDEDLRKLWLEQIGRRDFQPTEGSNICEDHFDPSLLNKRQSGRTFLAVSSVPIHSYDECTTCYQRKKEAVARYEYKQIVLRFTNVLYPRSTNSNNNIIIKKKNSEESDRQNPNEINEPHVGDSSFPMVIKGYAESSIGIIEHDYCNSQYLNAENDTTSVFEEEEETAGELNADFSEIYSNPEKNPDRLCFLPNIKTIFLYPIQSMIVPSTIKVANPLVKNQQKIQEQEVSPVNANIEENLEENQQKPQEQESSSMISNVKVAIPIKENKKLTENQVVSKLISHIKAANPLVKNQQKIEEQELSPVNANIKENPEENPEANQQKPQEQESSTMISNVKENQKLTENQEVSKLSSHAESTSRSLTPEEPTCSNIEEKPEEKQQKIQKQEFSMISNVKVAIPIKENQKLTENQEVSKLSSHNKDCEQDNESDEGVNKMKCYIPWCKSRRHKQTLGISFHRFPKDDILKAKWLEAIKCFGGKPLQNDLLCSIHFSNANFIHLEKKTILRSEAIPDINIDAPFSIIEECIEECAEEEEEEEGEELNLLKDSTPEEIQDSDSQIQDSNSQIQDSEDNSAEDEATCNKDSNSQIQDSEDNSAENEAISNKEETANDTAVNIQDPMKKAITITNIQEPIFNKEGKLIGVSNIKVPTKLKKTKKRKKTPDIQHPNEDVAESCPIRIVSVQSLQSPNKFFRTSVSPAAPIYSQENIKNRQIFSNNIPKTVSAAVTPAATQVKDFNERLKAAIAEIQAKHNNEKHALNSEIIKLQKRLIDKNKLIKRLQQQVRRRDERNKRFLRMFKDFNENGGEDNEDIHHQETKKRKIINDNSSQDEVVVVKTLQPRSFNIQGSIKNLEVGAVKNLQSSSTPFRNFQRSSMVNIIQSTAAIKNTQLTVIKNSQNTEDIVVQAAVNSILDKNCIPFQS